MRRSNIQSLSEVLQEYIREMKMERKLKEVDALHYWEELLGKTISNYTGNIYIARNVLYVKINSPVVKNELIMMREEIRRKMNEKAGGEIIQRIVFK
jgi:predicted nucleic acid-binding Zn ribbon protein